MWRGHRRIALVLLACTQAELQALLESGPAVAAASGSAGEDGSTHVLGVERGEPHIGAEVTEVSLGPASEFQEGRAERCTACGELVGIVAGDTLWVSSFDESEAGQQLESRCQDVGGNTFG